MAQKEVTSISISDINNLFQEMKSAPESKVQMVISEKDYLSILEIVRGLQRENKELKAKLQRTIRLKCWLLDFIVNRKAGNDIYSDLDQDCDNFAIRSFCQELLIRYDNFRLEAEESLKEKDND